MTDPDRLFERCWSNQRFHRIAKTRPLKRNVRPEAILTFEKIDVNFLIKILGVSIMQNTFEIGHLSREDKLKVMEAIWEDLSKEDEEVESPKWHQKALLETEERLNLGEEKKVDWSTAKKELRERF
jgi:hypothetical protein